MENRVKITGCAALIIAALFMLAAPGLLHGEELIKIGVLAKRGPDRCLQKWSPTAQYLSEKIPGKRFVVIPLEYDKVVPAVEKMEVHFILSNPLLYVEMEYLYGAVRIATLKNSHISNQYGGVIFCRADRADIRSLKDLKRKTKDLKGKTFMAVAENSFGGWIAGLREMKKIGINPNRDFAGLDFASTHDEVVYAVRDRDVDAGAIRTDTLERMNAEGKIDLKNYRVLSDHLTEDSGIFLLHSTRAYPEWPMAKLRHTSDNLAEKVAIALITMPSDSPAAVSAKCVGWTIPLSYQPIHECLRELRLGPYKHLGEITIAGVYKKYRHWILFTTFLLGMITIAGMFIIRLNLKFKTANKKMKTEIAERGKAQKELAKSELRFKDISLSMADWIWETDINWKYTFSSGNVKKMLGYDPEELIGKTFFELMPDDEAKRVKDILKKTASEIKQVVDLENRVVTKKGNEIFVITNGVPIIDNEGELMGYRGVDRDITSRKLAEAAVKKSLNTVQTILDIAPVGIVVIGRDKKIQKINDTAMKIIGVDSREEIIGKICHNRICPAQQGKCPILDLGQKVDSSERVVIYKKGRHIPVLKTALPITLEGEDVLLEVFTNISEIKKAKKALIEAKEAAEAANRSKSEFLANMSHEIRTPMNGILGFADILLEDELPQEHRDAIQTIKKSGETLLNLINDILDLSKVESSKIELETIPFNVEDLILDVGELARINLGEKQLEINCHTGDIHTNLLGDPARLRQIITNLTGNAVKFTQEGEIVISVTTEKEDDKQTTLKFSVRDTGLGIPEDKLEIIFESFKQADGSTTREYGGTGLGLTISKKLSQLMNGDMWVESEAGKGSVFYFTAKFKKDLKSSEEIHPVDVSQLEEKPILIVDDNETALKIVADMVTRVGMAPVLARSGEEALEYFRFSIADCSSERHQEQNGDIPGIKSSINNRQSTIEIAIIDIMMPEMSGHELADRISELTGGRTKMIALSSSAAIGFAAESQRSGFAGFVPKPVRRNVLIDMIRTVVGIGEKNLTSIVTQHSVNEAISHDVKILYAEDNPVNQKLGQKMLERMGYKAEIASDGAEAVKVVKEKGRFDIIFMDIQMPNMDGMEATKEIRKWESDHSTTQLLNHLPIIALTANAMKGDRENYLEAGMDDYLSKPFKKEDIQKMIRKWAPKDKVLVKTPYNNRILIIEDEENMRKSIIRLLRKEMPASRVMWAEDGIDATVKLGSFMPDLILADIMMPRMDGLEFIRYMRKTERYAKIKVIVITGLHKDDPRIDAVKKAGIDEIVYKPREDEDLIAAITDSLDS